MFFASPPLVQGSQKLVYRRVEMGTLPERIPLSSGSYGGADVMLMPVLSTADRTFSGLPSISMEPFLFQSETRGCPGPRQTINECSSSALIILLYPVLYPRI
jgi:hypothetical protein